MRYSPLLVDAVLDCETELSLLRPLAVRDTPELDRLLVSRLARAALIYLTYPTNQHPFELTQLWDNDITSKLYTVVVHTAKMVLARVRALNPSVSPAEIRRHLHIGYLITEGRNVIVVSDNYRTNGFSIDHEPLVIY